MVRDGRGLWVLVCGLATALCAGVGCGEDKTTESYMDLGWTGAPDADAEADAPGAETDAAPDSAPDVATDAEPGDGPGPDAPPPDASSPDVSGDAGHGTLRLAVRDPVHNPIEGASVTVGGVTAQTDPDGLATIADVRAGEVVALVQADKFANATTTATLAADGQLTRTIFLAGRATPEQVKVPAGKPFVVAGVTVEVPEQAFIDPEGQPVPQEAVRVSVAALAPDQGLLLPASLYGASAGGEDSPLAALVAVEITFTAQGRELQLGPGKTLTIAVPLEPNAAPAVGAALAGWRLDEDAGAWLEEAVGTVELDAHGAPRWAVELGHLSWWAAAAPAPAEACVDVTVTADGAPAVGVTVTGVGNGYLGLNTADTDGAGRACVAVRSAAEATLAVHHPELLLAEPHARVGGASAACGEGCDTASLELFSPGHCVQGRVTNPGGGPAVGVTVKLGSGPGQRTVWTDADGDYCGAVGGGGPVSVVAASPRSQATASVVPAAGGCGAGACAVADLTLNAQIVAACDGLPNGPQCNPGGGCLWDGVCLGGACVGVTAVDCDDSDSCTLDLCGLGSSACQYKAIPGCGDDLDLDGVADDKDNCPSEPNAGQADLDGDGAGDACDADTDGDGDPNATDCEPLDAGVSAGAPESCNGADDDCDGATDETHPDLDGDGLADCVDADRDGDGVDDTADNCPVTPNPGQQDADSDDKGDACAADSDGDSDPDTTDCEPGNGAVHHGAVEVCNGDDDNCSGLVDEGFADLDGDGKADCVDGDIDSDGIPNNSDVCPGVPDAAQVDTDSDGVGDACDDDDDGDGDPDANDCRPLDPTFGHGAPELCNGADDDCDGETDEGASASCSEGGPCVAGACEPPAECASALECDDGEVCTDDVCDRAVCVHSVFPGCLPIGCSKIMACILACTSGDGCFGSCMEAQNATARKLFDDWASCIGAECGGFSDEACLRQVSQGPCAEAKAACMGPDEDGDGFGELEDCDNGNGEVHPGAAETCNAVDDDCDGETDETNAVCPSGQVCADGVCQPKSP